MANENTDELMAKAETAFAMELASSAALHALSQAIPREVFRMTWLLGYCQGRRDALIQVQNMRDDSIPGRPEHDLDVYGRPLKAGS